MYGIYKMIMSTPRGDTENYLSIAENGIAVLSGMGIGQGTDVAIDGSKVSFVCSVGPGMWAFTLNIADGVIKGSAKHGELDDTAPIKGEKVDMDYDAAAEAAAKFQGPAGSGGDHGGPGGPGGSGQQADPSGFGLAGGNDGPHSAPQNRPNPPGGPPPGMGGPPPSR